MVKKGEIELQLVSANTGNTFKEYVRPNDGGAYIEVEPGSEYLIHIFHDGSSGPLIARLHNDGQIFHRFVASGNRVSETEEIDASGQEQVRIFKFPGQKRQHEEAIGDSPYWMGTLRIEIFQGTEINHYQNFKSYFLTGLKVAMGFDPSVVDAKSRKGPACMDSADGWYGPSGIPNLKCGEKVTEFEVHYCTAFGLIHVGILPRPLGWDAAQQAVDPVSAPPLPPTLYKRSKKVILAISQDDSLPPKEHDFIDLTVSD